MRKLLRIIGVLALLGAAAYLFLLFVVSPDFNNNQKTLVDSYLTNISSQTVCETHYNPETVSNCETFQTNYTSLTAPTFETTQSGSEVVITVTSGTSTMDFTVTFIEKDNTGLSGFFNSKVYTIDLIE